MYNAQGKPGTKITLADPGGEIIAEHTAAKTFGSVVISAPGIKAGGEYTLTVGGSSYKIKLTSLIYGSGGGMGGGRPGGCPGGGRPGGRR